MRDFFRTFCLCLAAGLLFFTAIAAFGVIAVSFEESGFSSGAFFRADFLGDSLFGEVLGRSFAVNLAAFRPPDWTKDLAVLLPPPVKFLIRLIQR